MIIAANEENAQFPYINAAPNNHPINEDYKTRNDFAASNTMVDWLTAMNDPRLGVYFNPAANATTGAFIGEVYGLSEDSAAVTDFGDVSQRGDAILAGDFPGIFFDAAQTHFLCAEAAERGWAGTPLDAAGSLQCRSDAQHAVVGSDGRRRHQRLPRSSGCGLRHGAR